MLTFSDCKVFVGMGPVTLCWCTRDVNFLRLQGVGGDGACDIVLVYM